MRLMLALLLLVLTAAQSQAQIVVGDTVTLNTGPCTLRSGSGSPEGVVTGAVCDTYFQTNSPYDIYHKTSGAGNTGWVAVPGGVGVQSSNTFYAGPTTGSALPTFRTIVNLDIDQAGVALSKVDDTNVTMTLGGSPTIALLNATSMTLGWTGTLAVARGGTGAATVAANLVFAGPTSGGAVAPTFRTTVNADIDSAGVALTKVDDTNVTLTLGGSPTIALVNAASLTLGWTGTLAATRGGTGQSVYAVGDLLYAPTTTTIGKLVAVAVGQVLASAGANTAPAYTATPSLTSIGGAANLTLNPTGNVALNPVTDIVSIDAGLHVGGVSAPGDNNLLVDGTTTMTGDGVFTANAGTANFVAQTTGWRMTAAGALDARDIFTDTLTVDTSAGINGYIGHPSYVSQTTNWRITAVGDADFRYLFTDELRAKIFTADLESVLAGSMRVTKSFSTISQTFTCPAASATSTLWVHDAPTFGDAAIFVSGDAVFIRSMTRVVFGPFSITDCVGVVTAYVDGTGGNAGQQSWTFTRGAPVSTIATSSIANPTIITTTGEHKLASGQTVTIASHTGSTPTINGARVVTVITPTTFSIPVNVTVGGTGGTSTPPTTGGNAGNMAAAATVAVDQLVQDMGVSGNGYVEISAVDGANGINAPYTQIVTWATAPVAANLTVRMRSGQLRGITGGWPVNVTSITRVTSTATVTTAVAHGAVTGNQVVMTGAAQAEYNGTFPITVTGATTFTYTVTGTPTTPATGTIVANFSEFGVIAGTYAATTGQYFRASDRVFEIHGINLLMWDGATNVIKLDRTAPSFAIGNPLPTAYGTGTGCWMGKDTVYKFRCGIPGGAGVFWDGVTLAIEGEVTAVTGVIGGWTIAATTLTGGNAVLTNTGDATFGTGNNIVRLSASDATYRLWVGDVIAASAPFSVTQGGTLKATSGTVGGWVLAATTLTGTNAVLTNTGNAAFGTANDIIRISADNANYRLWIGNANDATAPFRVSTTGGLVATNANITGTITATAGLIGAWEIGATYLRSAADDVGMSSAVTGGDDIRFWAGSTTMATAEFRVTEAGVLTATNAFITGTIDAEIGNIGGWVLGPDFIYDGAGVTGMSSAVTGGDDIRFWAGNFTRASAPFRVTEAGVLTASSVALTAGEVTLNSVGVTIAPDTLGTSWDPDHSYRFTVPTGTLGMNGRNLSGPTRSLGLESTWTGTGNAGTAVYLYATGESTDSNEALLTVLSLGTSSEISVFADVFDVTGLVTVNGFGTHTFSGGGNGDNRLDITNTTSDTAARAVGRWTAGTTLTQFASYSQGYTTSGANIAGSTMLYGSGVGGIGIVANDAAGDIRLYTGGQTLRGEMIQTGALRLTAYGAGTATFDASGNITSVSDERMKDIQGSFTRGLSAVMGIQPITFRYKATSGLDDENTYTGFSAQNILTVIPEAVGKNIDGFYSVNIVPVLAATINAVQTLAQEVDELRAAMKLSTRARTVPPIVGDALVVNSATPKRLAQIAAEAQALAERQAADAAALAACLKRGGAAEACAREVEARR